LVKIKNKKNNFFYLRIGIFGEGLGNTSFSASESSGDGTGSS
jgi:hypothetical protein